MFKWLISWFDREFPEIKEEPHKPYEGTTELAVVDTRPEYMVLEDELEIPAYQQEYLEQLRGFLTELNAAVLIGKFDNSKEDNDFNVLDFDQYVRYHMTFHTTDGQRFEVKYYDSAFAGRSTRLTFITWTEIAPVTQGGLFEDDTVLEESSKTGWTYGSIEHDGYPYCAKDAAVNSYIKEVVEKAVAHIKAIATNLPDIEKEHSPHVFHKLWEQMDLPLDTGSEMVKL